MCYLLNWTRLETMKLALQNGGDVTFREWAGHTPLSFVAERGDIAVTDLILEAKDAEF
jgi:ankyrin repeat protein